MNQRALILSLLVGAAAVLASAMTAPEMSATPVALAETDASASAASHIPVEAEDASVVALDAEIDTALHHHDDAAVEADTTDFEALDAEMGVAGMRFDSNLDMSMPTIDADAAIDAVAAEEGLDEEIAAEDAAAEAEGDDLALLSEGESLSVAMGDETEAATASSEESSESASAAVDSDEDAAFLEVAEADEEESDAEAEDEAEDEAEAEDESEDVGAVQTALIEQIVEANLADGEEGAAEDMPRLSEAGVEIVADAETAAEVAAAVDLGVTVAEEDHAHDAHTEMVTVEDFDTAKLAQSETDAVRTAGAVTAGLADATIEERNVAADTEPVDTDVIAVVSDADVRKAAGAPVAMMMETDARAELEATAESDAAAMAVEFHHQTAEETAAEQQKLDLMHSILVQIRTEQGKPVDDELTPADMDLIEEKMAVVSLVELTAGTDANADADAEANAKATLHADAEAEHPRDHTVVPAMAPNTESTTPGAKLAPATIITPGGAKPLVPPKPKYRWDIQYHGEDAQRIKYRANRDIELVDKPHPVHARDPTAPSKLKKPTKPGVWDRRPFETRPKQQYRYDVQYENRAACCRRREACCIRGVKSKTIAKKVKKAVRIVDPVAEARKARKAARKIARKVAAAAVSPAKKFVRVEYENERSRCCATRSACCAPPQAMYAADVQYDAGQPAAGYVVIAASGERALVVDPRDAGEYELDGAEEMSVLERIQARQQLLHKLLLTHDSPYYYDDHFDTASDAHIVAFHEPRAARDPEQLTVAEQRELQQWMQQLPVVPHLSVVEVTAEQHAASGDEQQAVFLQTAEGVEADAENEAFTVRPVMKPARVLKGFVDVEQDPSTLSQLLAALPPTPASAEEARDDMADAEAEAEADFAEDI